MPPLRAALPAPLGPAEAALPPRERQVGGRPYLLLGHGLRRRDGADWYTIALYVDEVGARRAFPALVARVGGRSHDKLVASDKVPPFLVWGDFGKLAVLRLESDLPAASLRAAFEEGLGSLRVDGRPPELRERVSAFLSLLSRDLHRGDQIELATSAGGTVEVTIAGERKEAATDARLARGLWQIWLGEKPISLELRRALIDRVEHLGGEPPAAR